MEYCRLYTIQGILHDLRGGSDLSKISFLEPAHTGNGQLPRLVWDLHSTSNLRLSALEVSTTEMVT